MSAPLRIFPYLIVTNHIFPILRFFSIKTFFVFQQSTQQHLLNQTATEQLVGGTMFSGSYAQNSNQTNPQSRLHQHRIYNNFDTYPPKKQQKPTSTKTLETPKHAMSIRSSPLQPSNTGRFYAKRFAASTTRRSFSESSAEKQLHKYSTTSDSSSNSQEEDEIIMSVADKRKMTRRSISNGLQYSHRYKSKHMERNAEDDVAVDGCTMFGKHSQYISDLADIAIRVILVVVFR